MGHKNYLLMIIALVLSMGMIGCVDSLNDPYPGFITTEKPDVSPEDYIESPTYLNISIFNQSNIFGLWWQDNSDNEDEFEIWRKDHDSEEFELLVLLPKNSIAYNDTVDNPSKIYSYKVRAINSLTDSEFSNEVNSAQSIGLSAPSDLIGAVIESTYNIELEWQDNSVNELGFILDRKLISEIDFSEVSRVGPNTENWVDTSQKLQPGITVSYRVRAYSSVDHSNYSNIFTITL